MTKKCKKLIYVTRSELRKAYDDCIKHKHGTENAIKFEIDCDIKLEHLYRELNSMTYTIGKSIVFCLRENNISTREVFAADFKDRIVHHLIVNRLRPSIEDNELIDDNYACREGKGTLYGALRCKQAIKKCSETGTVDCTIYKGDFKSFFTSLNKEQIYERLEQHVIKYMSNDRNMIFNLWLTKMIIYHCPQGSDNYIMKQPISFWDTLPSHKSLFNCDENHGIAIGNLTSQIFANFYLSVFDHYVTETLGYKYYGRYVDDFYIITRNSNTRIKKDAKKIREFAKSIDLNINVNKTYMQPYYHGVNFIGYYVYVNRMYIRNSTKEKFNNMVYSFNEELKNNYIGKKIMPSMLYIKKLQSRWNSYIGLFKHCSAYHIWNNALKDNPYVREVLLLYGTLDNDGIMHYKWFSKKLERQEIMNHRIFKFKEVKKLCAEEPEDWLKKII